MSPFEGLIPKQLSHLFYLASKEIDKDKHDCALESIYKASLNLQGFASIPLLHDLSPIESRLMLYKKLWIRIIVAMNAMDNVHRKDNKEYPWHHIYECFGYCPS